MKKIIKIIISIIILILFWISGYFWVTKILEIKEEKEMIKLITKEVKEGKFFEQNMEDFKKEEKLKKENAEIERLKATIVFNSKECKIESNSALWQNKLYWFKMCIPQDYLWYSPYAGRFMGKIYDGNEGIWLDNNNERDDWWFSSIWIKSHKKPYNIDNKPNIYLFETKTHIIEFTYDKSNKEHIEAIKSLKLYDKYKKIILDKEFLNEINKTNEDILGNILLENNY